MELVMIWAERGMEGDIDYDQIKKELMELYYYKHCMYLSIKDTDTLESAFKVVNFFVPTIKESVLSAGELKTRVKEFLEDTLAFYLERLLPITDVVKFTKDLYETLKNTGELGFIFVLVNKQGTNYYDLWDLPFKSDINDNIEYVLLKTISFH